MKAAGGGSGVQALVAAGATSVGARGLGNWLAARGFGWVTGRRVTIAVSMLTMVAITVVVLGTRETIFY